MGTALTSQVFKASSTVVNTPQVMARGHIAGLQLSNHTDASHDVQVTAGEARDASDTVDMVLSSAIVKQIDAAWAVGSAAGGLDTGAVANTTTYAVWLIKRSDTGVVDVLFSASFSSPTMPTNYDYKRLIGFVRTDGSANILAFTHTLPDLFVFTTPINQGDDTTITSGALETATLPVPPNSIAWITSRSDDTAGQFQFHQVQPAYQTGRTVGANHAAIYANTQAAAIQSGVAVEQWVPTNGSSQVQYGSDEDSTVTFKIYTHGCRMTTRMVA